MVALWGEKRDELKRVMGELRLRWQGRVHEACALLEDVHFSVRVCETLTMARAVLRASELWACRVREMAFV